MTKTADDDRLSGALSDAIHDVESAIAALERDGDARIAFRRLAQAASRLTNAASAHANSAEPADEQADSSRRGP